MNIKNVIEGVANILTLYFSSKIMKRYTGKIEIIVHCKNGGIGGWEVKSNQNFKNIVDINE